MMTHGEAAILIINLSADIGKVEHRDLWHYEQALYEIREMLEGDREFNKVNLLALPSAVVMCKDCIHRPIIDDPGSKDGFGLLFPDFSCPCRCADPYYSWMPNDNWFCGNGEKEAEENE